MLHFTIDRNLIMPTLLLLSGVSENRHTMEILGNICFRVRDNYLQLSATDTEIEISARISLPIDPEFQGETTVSSKKLIDICRAFPDHTLLTFTQKEQKILITGARSKFSLATLPSSDFPKIKEHIKVVQDEIKVSSLKTLLQTTSFSIAEQDIRYYLNGMLLESKKGSLISVATDTHRFALCEVDHPSEAPSFRIILPRKGVFELIKMLDLIEEETGSIQISQNHFYIETPMYTWISKLINGVYPNYSNVIPKNHDKAIRIDRDLLKQSLLRMSILLSDKYRAVLLSVQEGVLKIGVNNLDREEAEEEIEAVLDCANVVIRLNVQYVLEVLHQMPEGQVNISFLDPEGPILLESLIESRAKYIIMPMK